MRRPDRSRQRRVQLRRWGSVLLGLVVVVAGSAWLLRPPAEEELRALARGAADARHGVVFVPEVGELLGRVGGVLPDENPGSMLSSLRFWLRSSPAVLVVGAEGLEARVDLAPGRAMAAKVLGHLRRDARLRGGSLPDERSAVWWERGGGRSTSRWALARPQQARHLGDLGPPSPAPPRDGAADAWLAVPDVGSWNVWFVDPPSTSPGAEPRRVRLEGVRSSDGPAVEAPPRMSTTIWPDSGFEVSELFGSTTWLLSAERDGEGARVTLWMHTEARREGAAVDLEIPRIARWSTNSATAAGETLPAQDVVRRLGGEIRKEELADGTVLVGWDREAMALLRGQVDRLQALVDGLPAGGSSWFVRPAPLASWWGVAREFGRFGRPPEVAWWEQDGVRRLLERIECVEGRLEARTAVLEIAMAASDR